MKRRDFNKGLAIVSGAILSGIGLTTTAKKLTEPERFIWPEFIRQIEVLPDNDFGDTVHVHVLTHVFDSKIQKDYVICRESVRITEVHLPQGYSYDDVIKHPEAKDAYRRLERNANDIQKNGFVYHGQVDIGGTTTGSIRRYGS